MTKNRIQILKEKMLSQPRYVSIEQALIITKTYKQHENEPIILKRAYALANALRELEIGIENEELIVGNRTKGVRYGVVFPESGISWVDREFETIPTRKQDKFLVRDEDIKIFREQIVPYWKGKSLEDVIKQNFGQEISAINKVVKINRHIRYKLSDMLYLLYSTLLEAQMKKINQTNLKRRISLMLLITIFLMSSLVVGCGKKNVNTVSTKEDALVEETEESEKIEQETEIVQTENEEKKNLGTFVLYFSGIDVWGWTDTKSRSDVNIIAAVNTETRHVQLINTPRDYFVEMPISNGAKDKLTHAGLYGVENSVGTLEKLYDVDIDYYLRVNFSGFEAIIDTLGGVDVYSEYDFTVDPIKHYTEGYNHLTGLEALAFVRERHAFASGDNQRGRNQMAMLQALIKKVSSIEFLENYNEVMDELTDMYRTNIPDELLKDLVFNQLMDGTEWTVDIYSVTGSGGSEKTYSAPNSAAYVMIPNDNDVAQAKSLIEAVLNETP